MCRHMSKHECEHVYACELTIGAYTCVCPYRGWDIFAWVY